MSDPINWDHLAQEIEERHQAGLPAVSALELIVGEDTIRQAVDYYVAWRPERELARSFLRRFRPWSAMQRCYEIYKISIDIDDRRAALNLLGDIADGRVLDWIDEFLADPDEGIQTWGIGVLDRVLWGGGIRQNEAAMEKAYKLLDVGESHNNPHVGSTAAYVRAYIVKQESYWDGYEAYRAGLENPPKETMP